MPIRSSSYPHFHSVIYLAPSPQLLPWMYSSPPQPFLIDYSKSYSPERIEKQQWLSMWATLFLQLLLIEGTTMTYVVRPSMWTLTAHYRKSSMQWCIDLILDPNFGMYRCIPGLTGNSSHLKLLWWSLRSLNSKMSLIGCQLWPSKLYRLWTQREAW